MKKFLAVLIVLAMALSLTIVAVADTTTSGSRGDADIEFVDTRGGGSIIVDPEEEDVDDPENPLPPPVDSNDNWADLAVDGLTFWEHDLANVQRATQYPTGATDNNITFNSIRYENDGWDVDKGDDGEHESHTAILVQSFANTVTLTVARTGFHVVTAGNTLGLTTSAPGFPNDGVEHSARHVLNGFTMNLNEVERIQSVADAYTNLVGNINNLQHGSGGILGTAAAVTSGNIPAEAVVGAKYSASITGTVATAMQAGVAEAHAILLWTIASTPVTP